MCLFFFFFQSSIEERLKQLQDAHRDFGPGSQHFLSSKSSPVLFEVSASCCTNLFHAVPKRRLRVYIKKTSVRSTHVWLFGLEVALTGFVCLSLFISQGTLLRLASPVPLIATVGPHFSSRTCLCILSLLLPAALQRLHRGSRGLTNVI